jgi:hypothetical protein
MRRLLYGCISVLSAFVIFSIIQCVSSKSGSNPDKHVSCDSTNTGYFDIAAPQSGQSLMMGVQDSIVWSNLKSPFDSIVSLYLCKGKQIVKPIAIGVKNRGTLPWKVPYIGTGEDYRIKICSAIDTARFNYGCPFNLYSDCLGSFTIVRPETAAVCTAGASFQIQWKSTGILKDSVVLELCFDSLPRSLITSQTGNTGRYSWSIPDSLMTKDNYRIKIACYYDNAIYALSAPFSVIKEDSLQNCSPDSFEPDNRPELASKRLQIGIAQTHTLSKNDTDWVAFSAESGKVYRLLASGTVLTSIRMYYEKDTSPLSDSDSGWTVIGPGVISLKWPCLKGGTWLARIILSPKSSGSGCGAYSFDVSSQDSLSVTTVSSPAQGAAWAAGATQQIKWTPDTTLLGNKVTIYLFKGPQQLFTIATNVSNSGVYNWTLLWGFVTGNDYLIRIVNNSNANAEASSARFTINGVIPDAYEPDNKRDSASTLSPLGKAQSHTLTMNDTDWVKFSADSGEHIVQCFGDIAMKIDIFYGNDVSNTTYFYNAALGSTITWTCPKAGIWYARIAAISNLDGAQYMFNVAKFDSLNSVSISAPAKDTIWWTGYTHRVLWNTDSAFLGTNVNIYLHKGSQGILLRWGNISNSGAYSFNIPDGLTTGSDYRIEIVNAAHPNLFGYGSFFTINGIAPDAFEPDNKRDSASTLTIGKAQNHNLTLNDTDWVKFSADSGKNYLIQYPGTTDMRLFLYEGSSSVVRNIFYSSSTKSSYAWMCPASGVWCVRIAIQPNYTSNSTYTFNVTAWDSLNAVSFSSPTVASVWNAGSNINIQWTSENGALGTYQYLWLYKGGREIQYITNGTFNTSGACDWSIPAGIVSGSDYRVKIMNSSNPSFYAFSPAFTINGIAGDSYEPDDSSSQASLIVVDNPSQSRSLSVGDQDWVRFAAQKDSIYSIEAIPGSTSLNYINFFIYNESDFSSSKNGYSTQNSKFIWSCPKSGTYYLDIQPGDPSNYGNYSLAIKKFSLGTNLKFVNPNELSVWASGSSYQIQWVVDTAVFGSYVTLQLYLDTTYVMDIMSSFNTGVFSFPVPLGLITSNKYKIKLLSGNSPYLFLSSPAFTISGIAADAFEPDDYVEIAHQIATTGAPENHTLTYNDVDYFKFTTVPNYLYVVKTIGATNFISTQLNLYDATGYYPISSAYSTTADSSATIIVFSSMEESYLFSASTSTPGAYQAMVLAYDSTKYALNITAPPSGTTLLTGQTDTIKWASQIMVGYVDIYLYKSSSGGLVQTIATTLVNSGSYTWTVPTLTAESGYYVKIISQTSSHILGKSGEFTIRAN